MIDGLRRIPFFLFAASLGLQAQTPAAPASSGAASAAPAAAISSPTMAPPPAAESASGVPADPAAPLLKKAYELIVTKKDYDNALGMVDTAVKNNPKSFASLTLRGMIYSQKKQWTSAEADFNAALALDPTNMVVKFNLGEIRFVQKDYDNARARFLPLAKDPNMGDFASYKVFLCDLFGKHEEQAQQELDVFNKAETHPSYYFSNAAWDLVHQNTEDARSWLGSAQSIYIPAKIEFYAASLRDLGYLPLPPPAKP